MRARHFAPVLLTLALIASVADGALAAPAKAAAKAAAGKELTVDEIMEKAMSKGAVGFKQGQATIRMTITDPKGEASERTLRIQAMKGADGMLRSMVKFTKPASVNGTAFLVVEKKDALPDQYVYVPKAKVVRRIAAGNATSTFFGSDFTFGDLMPLPMSQKDKIQIDKLPDGDVGGQPVHIISIVPKIEGSPYGKVVAYVHKDLLIPLKIEFFDPAMKPLKVLKVKKLQKVEGETVPVEVEMKAEAGSKTELVLETVEPNAKLSDSDFTEEAMQR